MASIQKRNNGKWRARYRDEVGKEHARHFDRKTDAQKWLDQVTASVVRGDYVDPRAGMILLRDYASAWEAMQVASDSTKRINDNALRLHILPRLGDHPMKAIKPSMVQSFVKALEAKGLSPGTVRGVYHVLTQVFSAAVLDEKLVRSPCVKVKLPDADKGEVVPPTLDEVSALVDAMDTRWRAAVVLLAGSGLRVGEMLGLEVEDVDFLRRTVKVSKQRRQDGTLGPPKSDSSRRTVPVGQVVIDELAAHLASYPSDGALFLDELGQPLIYRRWRTLMEAASRQAGVTHTAHALRHFYASALIGGGASIKVVQKRLGHYSAMITLQVYAHLFDDEDTRTRDVMDAALAPLADSLRTGTTSTG